MSDTYIKKIICGVKKRTDEDAFIFLSHVSLCWVLQHCLLLFCTLKGLLSCWHVSIPFFTLVILKQIPSYWGFESCDQKFHLSFFYQWPSLICCLSVKFSHFLKLTDLKLLGLFETNFSWMAIGLPPTTTTTEIFPDTPSSILDGHH